MRLRVYVAGPMKKGHPTPTDNLRNAALAADEIMKVGHTAYVPQLSYLLGAIIPHAEDVWLDCDYSWISVCHALYRLPGESRGADMEVKFAEIRRIPVFTHLAELLNWLRLAE